MPTKLPKIKVNIRAPKHKQWKPAPLFMTNCLESYSTAQAILGDRRKQYDENADLAGTDIEWEWANFVAVRTTLAFIEKHNPDKSKWTRHEYRTIASASFVDQKYIRLAGAYKKDTPLDLLNYVANWQAEMANLAKRYGVVL